MRISKSEHVERMGRRAARRERDHLATSARHVSVPVVNRHTGQPHEHAREIARRARQSAVLAKATSPQGEGSQA